VSNLTDQVESSLGQRRIQQLGRDALDHGPEVPDLARCECRLRERSQARVLRRIQPVDGIGQNVQITLVLGQPIEPALY
jgi:hypothetical protein